MENGGEIFLTPGVNSLSDVASAAYPFSSGVTEVAQE